MADDVNTNLFVHIAAIEGLTEQINRHLEALSEDTVERSNTTQKTWKSLAEWQKTDLHELRKVYE